MSDCADMKSTYGLIRYCVWLFYPDDREKPLSINSYCLVLYVEMDHDNNRTVRLSLLKKICCNFPELLN